MQGSKIIPGLLFCSLREYIGSVTRTLSKWERVIKVKTMFSCKSKQVNEAKGHLFHILL